MLINFAYFLHRIAKFSQLDPSALPILDTHLFSDDRLKAFVSFIFLAMFRTGSFSWNFRLWLPNNQMFFARACGAWGIDIVLSGFVIEDNHSRTGAC